ncbi:MAG: efflux RND transporter periplasmic adaptor subunit [Parvibaculum sp.]
MPEFLQKHATVRAGIAVVVAALLISAAAFYWTTQRNAALPAGIAMSNGRIEAERVDVATKYAGRIDEIRVDEGDFVVAGQIVAWMDDGQIKAQVAAATADVRQAEQHKSQSEAVIAQREAELDLARQEYERADQLIKRGHTSREQLDQRRAQLRTAEAALATARAGKTAAEAGIQAAEANLAQLRDMLDDMVLTAPRSGRVQYRVAEPGEVLPAGGRVLTLLDLSNVYMTIFLPAGEAGRLAMGDEARLVLDPIPEFVIPAHVSFVAADAQFTPKTVETQEERENLMFRVKLQIGADLLARVEARVKTGVRGVGYVKTASTAEWPDWLAVKLPAAASGAEAAVDE